MQMCMLRTKGKEKQIFHLEIVMKFKPNLKVTHGYN